MHRHSAPSAVLFGEPLFCAARKHQIQNLPPTHSRPLKFESLQSFPPKLESAINIDREKTRAPHFGKSLDSHLKFVEVRPAGFLVEMLRDLVPRGQPVVPHVFPRLVVVPPARGPEGLLDLEEKGQENMKLDPKIHRLKMLNECVVVIFLVVFLPIVYEPCLFGPQIELE